LFCIPFPPVLALSSTSICLCSSVKQNALEVTAFSQLGEKINHESEPRSHELMGEPEEDVEENVMQQEKDISNQSMTVHKIMQDAEKVAVGLLARRLKHSFNFIALLLFFVGC
jgi:hypothetical protein